MSPVRPVSSGGIPGIGGWDGGKGRRRDSGMVGGLGRRGVGRGHVGGDAGRVWERSRLPRRATHERVAMATTSRDVHRPARRHCRLPFTTSDLSVADAREGGQAAVGDGGFPHDWPAHPPVDTEPCDRGPHRQRPGKLTLASDHSGPFRQTRQPAAMTAVCESAKRDVAA